MCFEMWFRLVDHVETRNKPDTTWSHQLETIYHVLPVYAGLHPDTCPRITFSVFFRFVGFNGFDGCWKERWGVCYTWTSHATAETHRQQLCTSNGGRRDNPERRMHANQTMDHRLRQYPQPFAHSAGGFSCFSRLLCSGYPRGLSETHSHPSLPMTGKPTH